MQTATIDSTKQWTVEDYLQLEEGLLAQLIDGEIIMSPAPNLKHQAVLKHLFDLFYDLEKDGLGLTYFSPVDLHIDKTNVFQPDLIFVLNDNKDIFSDRGIEGPPDLIVEAISPSNSFIDRNTKKKKYLQFGVKEYWIVDPANETLEIYSGNEEKPILYLAEEGEVTSKVLPALKFNLSQIF
ncbi:MAG: Uma2 family endonuclease [Cyclobacteriaceae bacterium]